MCALGVARQDRTEILYVGQAKSDAQRTRSFHSLEWKVMGHETSNRVKVVSADVVKMFSKCVRDEFPAKWIFTLSREIKIHRYTSESSFSDIPRQFTGADIRNQDTNNTYLIVPTGGHLRSAFSEVEGLDRYAQKGSQNTSSKEIERTKNASSRTS
ncbi:uncharacterized protein DEA37_0005625 [Paragonimus westermani]|uniref:Uncharacterized protein n=1 Tax=Paragonimus westermani TaxID=34504 RepID=A0A5J4NNR4_9TREM|nr:uncharacterized protein DEA37_0005625 [Paragonimus westermani]